jgi:hypothetical protein
MVDMRWVSRGGFGWVGFHSMVDVGSVVLSAGTNWWEDSSVDGGIKAFV